MSQQMPEDPDTKPTALFFPVMSTLLFIGLTIYELPGFYGWIYLAIAIFGVVTVYLAWKKNKSRQSLHREEEDSQQSGPDGGKQEKNL